MRLKTILLMMLCCMGTAAQTAYKGQLHVSDERFYLQGQLLRVYMKVSYDSDALNMLTRVGISSFSPLWNSIELGSESDWSDGLQIMMHRFSKYILCILFVIFAQV